MPRAAEPEDEVAIIRLPFSNEIDLLLNVSQPCCNQNGRASYAS